MSDTRQAAREFWKRFAEVRDRLAGIQTADHPLYDDLLERLHAIDGGLWFEFAAEPAGGEIAITADGDTTLFPLVEEVVAEAPDLPGWEVHALKPCLGFPRQAAWEGWSVLVADLSFDPLETEGGEDLGIRVYVPGLPAADEEPALAAILRAIDHGLGERAFAEEIQHVEVAPRPEDARPGDAIPLSDLRLYLDWRKSGGDRVDREDA